MSVNSEAVMRVVLLSDFRLQRYNFILNLANLFQCIFAKEKSVENNNFATMSNIQFLYDSSAWIMDI